MCVSNKRENRCPPPGSPGFFLGFNFLQGKKNNLKIARNDGCGWLMSDSPRARDKHYRSKPGLSVIPDASGFHLTAEERHRNGHHRIDAWREIESESDQEIARKGKHRSFLGEQRTEIA